MNALAVQASSLMRVARPTWRRVRHALAVLVRARRHAPPPALYGPLTVGALIAQLRRFDPDLRVIMPGEAEDWTDVHEAHLDIFSPQTRHPELLQLADDGDPKAVRMVRLFGDPEAG